MFDHILIEELQLRCQIGITEEERAEPQRVSASLSIVPIRGFSGLRDDIRNAVDYAKVADCAQEVSVRVPYRLLETLGVDIADAIISNYAVLSVDIHLKKFVLPGTKSVGIRLRRERPAGTPIFPASSGRR